MITLVYPVEKAKKRQTACFEAAVDARHPSSDLSEKELRTTENNTENAGAFPIPQKTLPDGEKNTIG
ncbi:hypothetical protein [Bacillus sp. T33-2]|uniref:hypothetical protein n=1 Tax=Bacillus sp. T33-2 TaxID=2054168 RepID=UPI000C77D330|nr:hypothetical protein [Bacillus sp. T33-2]PLR98412.1 hypothetical protein CVD19_04830 [Bacillus sp. T33-2]